MTRLKDPQLLRDLHELWDEWGCACCGTNPGPSAPPGIALELAHIIRRSQGGPDTTDNILGLCPSCHHGYDLYRINVKRNEAGILVWLDTAPGKHGWQACRIPPEVEAMIEAASQNGGGWNVSHETPGDGPLTDGALSASPVQDPAVTVDGPHPAGSALLPASDTADTPVPAAANPDVVLPTTSPLGDTSPEAPLVANQDVAGGESPLPVVVDELVETSSAAVNGGDLVPATGGGEAHEQRYTALRGLVRRSERDRLAAAVLLWEAREQRDHELLGVSWQEYVSDAGLSKSAASKMLKAADVFRGQWLQLAQCDQADLNLERVYLASRLVSEQGMETMDALHEAVANPSHQLVAQLKGDEPSDRCECECPNCGRKINHIKEATS